MTVELQEHGNGIWTAPGARLIDRMGRKRLPVGDDGFTRAAAGSVVTDKTALIADVLDSGYTATLFCRPRRFGKTLNMAMMKAFFEASPAGGGRLRSVRGDRDLGDGWRCLPGALCRVPRHLPEHAYREGRYLGADV